ncbi:unnamed protein product [Soboliphyme baturini]|uniref:Fork-head domain-containing protein n=1 Tax=Soboliphyme baturini TaxID=241478 RepID=A0A3P8DLT6_9BILA|nr:unnamed protein product [Soboliphyme baturini]
MAYREYLLVSKHKHILPSSSLLRRHQRNSGSRDTSSVHGPCFLATDNDLQCLDWLHSFTFTLPVCDTPVSFVGLSDDETCLSSVPSTHRPCRIGCMIFRAIESSPYQALPLCEIYDLLRSQADGYSQGSARFQNHVRHVLSDSCCFVRLKRFKLGTVGTQLFSFIRYF